ncbi:MAG: hypothetical protein PHE26_05105 [Syntrophomonadaceae bacterium]|nr:hypothetical protein [Syntrophomonadaceae bacterium]
MKFFSGNYPKELVLFGFFLCIAFYCIIVYALKKKRPLIVERSSIVFQAVTVVITLAFLAISTIVPGMCSPLFPYQILIGLTSCLVYAVCISGLAVSKILGLEFKNERKKASSYLYSYGELADEISACMSEFVDLLTFEVIDTLRGITDVKDLTNAWAKLISRYVESRKVTAIKNLFTNIEDDVLQNYISNIVAKKKLWYNEKQIKSMVKDLRKFKVVELDSKQRLIPMEDMLLYVEAKEELVKLDDEFIINTFKMVYLICQT